MIDSLKVPILCLKGPPMYSRVLFSSKNSKHRFYYILYWVITIYFRMLWKYQKKFWFDNTVYSCHFVLLHDTPNISFNFLTFDEIRCHFLMLSGVSDDHRVVKMTNLHDFCTFADILFISWQLLTFSEILLSYKLTFLLFLGSGCLCHFLTFMSCIQSRCQYSL